MKLLLHVFKKASTSPFYLWILNHLLWKLIPFNRPHQVRIESIDHAAVVIRLPYKRRNRNHLKGMHACALATLCEYACGIGLMSALDPQKYRIILKSIRLDYHAQAKTAVYACFEMNPQAIEQEVIVPLQQLGVLVKSYTIQAYDEYYKHVCTGEVTWQLKSWEKVSERGIS